MDILFYLFIVGAIIAAVYTNGSNEKAIQKYIADKKGEFVSKSREYFDVKGMFSNNSTSYKLVYYDKNRVLRAVLLRESFIGVEFSGDHKVHSHDKSYFENDVVIENPKTKTVNEKPLFVDYTYNVDIDKLIIQQQFYHPNKGEIVLLNKTQAPKGKYKIGFMNYIHIEDGRIKNITMF